jgi:septal ring factor EnvC (AmiA/AmiB activator)
MRLHEYILCFAAAAASLLPGAAADAASTRQTEAELRSLNQKIDHMTQQVSHDAVERERQSAALRTAEISLGQARGEVGRLDRQVAESTARRAILTQEKDREQQILASERTALAGQLRAAYMLGSEEPLKLLLNQRDPLNAGRLYSYYGYFGQARARQIADISDRVHHLQELDDELAQQQAALTGLKTSRQMQLSQLERARDQRQTVLVSFNAAAQGREQSLSRLKTQHEDLERLLEELSRSLKTVPPPDNATSFGRARGQLRWPVTGHVTAQYGSNRAGNVNWEGVVIGTVRGAPVTAVAAGRVVYADWLPGLGLLVILDHGDGYMSLYGHNDRLLKGVGESVGAGDTIAAAGDTGGRASPELYFEIRRAGRPVDPAPWFKASHPEP